MGFRFRKTISIFPGVHLNLSKSGPSVSLGTRGAMVNVGHGQETVSLGVPGTGMGYKTSSGSAILIIIALAALVALAWYIDPEPVRRALHWWQPHWF